MFLTGDITRRTLMLYILFTGLSTISIGLCIICRKRVTDNLHAARKKTTPANSVQLQNIDRDNIRKSDSLYDIVNERNEVDEH